MLGIRTATFMAWIILTLVVGAALLIAPGRFLTFFGWLPVEPILDRILGAALLASSWLAVRGWKTSDAKVQTLVAEIQGVFCAFGVLGILRHLIGPAHYPLMVWVVCAVMATFAALWLAVRVTARNRL